MSSVKANPPGSAGVAWSIVTLNGVAAVPSPSARLMYADPGSGVVWNVIREKTWSVITSYSIHYTKLYEFWASLGVIALHLVPTAVVLAVLALAWRHEVAGSIAYLALAAGYLIMAAGRFHWSVIAAISGSLAGLGILFFASWWTGRHSGTTATG